MLIHGVASLSEEQAGCRLAACWERVWFVLRLRSISLESCVLGNSGGVKEMVDAGAQETVPETGTEPVYYRIW